MSLREAAEKALEALTYAWHEDEAHPESKAIIGALRDALAEAEKAEAAKAEPVAWMHNQRVDCIHNEVKELLKRAGGHLHRPLDKTENYTIPLYADPTAALPESADEDAAIAKAWDRFTAELENPSPLTDEEILEIWSPSLDCSVQRPILGKNKIIAFARAVLAAARGKG